MSKKLAKSAFIVSFMTLLSRISGLVRDVIFASFLGSSAITDAFFVAFRIPNLFRRIFAEGAFSLAFVPVFSEYLSSKSNQEIQGFVNAVATRLSVFLLIFCSLGMLFSDQLILFFAPGFRADPLKLQMSSQVLFITFPYLFFISMVAMSAGILNSKNQFAIPAITPIFLNICLILGVVLFIKNTSNPSLVLALSVVIAGIIQFLFQLPYLSRIGLLPKPSLKSARQKNEGVSKVFKLMLPAIYGASIAQINMLINTILASFLVTGSVSWLYYSDRLVEFPLALFGIAISTVILPNLSTQHVKENNEQFSNLLDWGLRLGLAIAIPCAFGIFVLSMPVLATLFNYNQFSDHDVIMSSMSLQAYSFGIIGFILVKILAPGFYAKQDTKTPVKIGIVAVIVNVVMALLLISSFKHVGLAMAITISSWVNALLLLILLIKKGSYHPGNRWLGYLAKLLLSAIIMSVVVYYFAGDKHLWLNYSFSQRIVKLVLSILVGIITYVVMIYVMGLRLKKLLNSEIVRNEK